MRVFYHIKIEKKNNNGWVMLNVILINVFKLRVIQWVALLLNSKFSKSEDYDYLCDKRWYDFTTYQEIYWIAGLSRQSIF